MHVFKGRDFPNLVGSEGIVAVVSAWEWNDCTSSIIGHDPNTFGSGLAVFQGVPMREGERKRLIFDTDPCHFRGGTCTAEPLRRYEAIAGPSDSVALGSWTKPDKMGYYIAVSDIAFEVAKFYVSRPRHEPTILAEARTGFRKMQDAYWVLIHLLPASIQLL